MLVVVHHGDVEFLLEATLDFEALGSLDVLQVDTTECGGDSLYGLDELLGILLVYLDVEYIDACVYFEQQTLTFHYGLASQCAYVAEAEYGSTV